MLDTILGKGFLCHKLTRIKLHPHVNLFMGVSDKGKSSIVRLIRWVEQNKPNGESFINWDMSSCTGMLKTMEGDEVERNKGKGVNNYVINGEDPLEAMGQGVPEEVSDILNLAPINYSLQSSPHFLLTSTPGQVAKTINEIADLTIIDTAIKNIQDKSRENTRAIKEAKASMLEAEIKIQGLAFVEKLQRDFDAVSEMEQGLSSSKRDEANLETITDSCAILEESIEKADSIISLESLIAELEGLEQTALASKRDEDKLERRIEICEDVALRLKNIPDLGSLEGMIKNIEDIAEQMEEIEDSGRELKKLCQDSESTERTIDCLDGEIGNFESLLEKEMPDECPLCGRSE